MNVKNKEGFRVCLKCKIEKELTSENYHKDKNRLCGFMYRCKKCEKNRKDNRKSRYKNSTPFQKEKSKERNRKYGRTNSGVAVQRFCSYRKRDKEVGRDFDLDTDFLLENIIGKDCFYCGFCAVGCDRINNSKGHTKNNVVPCCKECNVARMDNFTHEEMIMIGKVIRLIKLKRQKVELAILN